MKKSDEAQFSKKKDFLEEIGHKRGFKFTFRKSVLKVSNPPGMLSVEQGGLDLDMSLNLDLLFDDPPYGDNLKGIVIQRY